MGFTVEKGSEKGSEKGISRRCLERPLGEYAPLGVRPIKIGSSSPKRPSHTKNTTESEFRYGEKIRYRRSKTPRRGLRNACFSRHKRQENGTESETHYAVVKILRIPY